MKRDEQLKEAAIARYGNNGNESQYMLAKIQAFMAGGRYADEHPNGSLIKWQTGEPKEEGWYLATCKNDESVSFVTLVHYDGSKWNADLGRNLRKEVIIESWVKISTIKPCKFNNIQK